MSMIHSGIPWIWLIWRHVSYFFFFFWVWPPMAHHTSETALWWSAQIRAFASIRFVWVFLPKILTCNQTDLQLTPLLKVCRSDGCKSSNFKTSPFDRSNCCRYTMTLNNHQLFNQLKSMHLYRSFLLIIY